MNGRTRATEEKYQASVILIMVENEKLGKLVVEEWK